MIRVVLDANQFVSALLKPDSNSAQILTLVREDKVRLVLSDAILSEIAGVLLYPKIQKRHGRSPEFIAEFMRRLCSVAILTEGKLKIEEIKDDPSDNKYLECAVEGTADFIISGDHHLKSLQSFRGIRIVDPATFLSMIRKK
jgi:putative PIN family toxin of toxin-antitoxin system